MEHSIIVALVSGWVAPIAMSAFVISAIRFSWRAVRSDGRTFWRSVVVAPVIAVLAVIAVPVWAAEQTVVGLLQGRRPSRPKT